MLEEIWMIVKYLFALKDLKDRA